MSVSTKVKTGSIAITKKAKVKFAKTPSMTDFRQREQQRRIDEKIEFLEQYDTSEQLFTRLRGEIDTLAYDESSHDMSVKDDYNFGVDYEVDLILELIRDLRSFTRYNHCDDDDSITQFGLDYLRPYF